MKIALQCLVLFLLALPVAAQCGPTGVAVTVSPLNPALGQPVAITLANNSNQLVQLPSNCVIASISTGSNCISQSVFTPLCLAVITPIPPGQSVTMIWDQTDNLGNPVAPNGYSVEVIYWDANFTALTNCCIPFEVGNSLTSHCFGDGGDQLGCTNCPCGNNAPINSGGGCLNSAGTSTRLHVTGSTSVSLPASASADLRFSVSNAPGNALCILNSGDALAPGNPNNPCSGQDSGIRAAVYDGLRCAIANTRRHGSRAADPLGNVGTTGSPWGGEGNPPAGIANAGSGFATGQTRFFQVIHRDDSLEVCMRGLNTSQAIEVTFTP